jgi:hypothetical protein
LEDEMNPETNKFEGLTEETTDALKKELTAKERRLGKALAGHQEKRLLRPNGEPVPEHWPVFSVGEKVVVKNYTFKVAHIGESHLLLEPTGPLLVGED